jgi:hypothetical protein
MTSLNAPQVHAAAAVAAAVNAGGAFAVNTGFTGIIAA